MEKIELSNEAHSNIEELLKCITYSSAINPDVTGIFMKEYNYENNNKPTIELVSITTNDDYPLREIRKFYAKRIEEIRHLFGVNVLITACLDSQLNFFPELDFDNLESLDVIMQYVRCRDLMNSEVVYDPEGKYQELKERLMAAHNQEEMTYNNLVEFAPPLNLKRKRPF